MEEETIKEVKMTLRSLVVSSPTQMDSRQLMRDYSKLLGTHIPLARMGYRDLVTFLRERCSDSFLLSGPSSNPILTVIVPESSKHIDNFVQRSKIPSTAKVKTKRRSIHEAKVVQPNQNHIYNSFVNHKPPIIGETKEVEVKAPDIIPKSTSQNKENVDHHKNTTVTSNDVKNFLKKRTALYNSLHNLDETTSEKDGAQSLFQDDDSGRHTSSSGSSTKTRQFEELKSEIMQLITAAPEGVWCTDLIRLYRERYNRELNFARFGYTSIVSLLYVLEARVHITRPDDTGDWLLAERARAAPSPPALRPRAHAAHAAHAARAHQPDPDDALPGVQFDEDVFPADCMRFSESIPALSLADCRPGAMLEVMVGEVYSPSHFWLIRLGERYNLAMEEIMDEMTLYYNGEGRGRALARGAVRVGHYCSTLYENDWHRSVIVKIIDSDTVKVRHVDYGTVESVRVSELRALRREWGALPAQAVRARLAGLRPSAAGRRWPHAAAAHFLRRVQDKRLYANVVAVDTEHDVLETLLIDTRGAEDVCVSTELIRAGHADARADSALRTAECYLYPRFEALEEGDTPNMAEIHAYLRDGIALDYVEAYRRHVPVCLPEPEPSGPPAHGPPPAEHEWYVAELASPQDTLHELYVAEPPAPPSPELATRIPLLWPCATPAPPCPTREDPASVPPAPAAPPPARTLPAPVFEQTPGTPPRDSRPPEARVEPSVVSQSTINPEAQSFTPKPCYNREPAPPRVPWAGPQGAAGAVTLSAAECDMYRQLACVHPGAAHCYMASTLARAMGRPAAAGPQPSMGPPVGAAPWHSMGPPAGAAPWPSMGFPNGARPWPSMGPPNGVGLWPAMGPPTGAVPRPAMGSPGRAGPWPTIGPPDGAGPWTAMGPSDCVGPGPRMGPMRWPPGFRP